MKNLIRSVVLAFSISLQLVAATPTLAAGPYTDELSKCLVRSTTTADRALLVQWIFVTLALHPDVKLLVTASDDQRSALNKRSAQLLERLLTDNCVSEARQALRYEGEGAIEASGGVLGRVATRELMTSPSVNNGLVEFGKYVDEKRVQKKLRSQR